MRVKIVFILILFIYYNISAQDLKSAGEKAFSCGTSDANISPAMTELIRAARPSFGTNQLQGGMRELRLAVVIDSTVYYAFKGDTLAMKENFLMAMRYASTTIFEPQFNVRLNMVFTEYSTKDRQYNGTGDNYDAFSKFISDYNERIEIDRDIMVLWSIYKKEPYIGVANSIGFWGNSPTIHVTSSSIEGMELVRVLIHEIGHIMGSPHTHDCVWPEGPFEVCKSELNCPYDARSVVWASVMSYCVGTHYFHPLSVDVIKKASYPVLEVTEKKPGKAPEIYFPVNELKDFYPTSNFSWSAVEKVTAYRVHIAEMPDFGVPVLDTLVSDHLFFSGKSLKRNTKYHWRVRAENEFGNGGWSDSFSFTTHRELILKKPEPLVLDETRGGEDIVFSFKPMNDASYYEVQLLDSPASPQPFAEKRIFRSSFRLGEVADLPRAYFFRVRASAADGKKGEWSDFKFFELRNKTTIHAYKSPVSIRPALHFSDDMLPYLSTGFYRREHLDRTYLLELSEKNDFSQSVLKKEIRYNYNGGTRFQKVRNTILLDSLKPQTNYYYRYKVTSGLDSSDWIASSFTTSYENRWKSYNYQNSILPFAGVLNSIFLDSWNNRWVLGRGGIYFIPSSGGNEVVFDEKTNREILSNDVTAMCEGPDGSLWMAAVNGIMRYNKGLWKSYHKNLWDQKKENIGVSNMVVTSKNILYFHDYANNKILEFDGSTWKNIIDGSGINPGYRNLMRGDNKGNLWVINLNPLDIKVRIYDGKEWSDYVNPGLLRTSAYQLPFLDNEGNIYAMYNGSYIRIKDNSGQYEVINLNGFYAMDDNTGKMTNLASNYLPRLQAVYKRLGRTLYTLSVPGDETVLLEDDGKVWRLRHREGRFNEVTEPVYVLDNNDMLIVLQGANTMQVFNPREVITDFSQESAIAGCKIKFRIGVATPPPGNAEQNNLKVYLTESSSPPHRQIPAVYDNGLVTFTVPEELKGHVYQFWFTMGDNWLQSNLSYPFEIVKDEVKLSSYMADCDSQNPRLSVLFWGEKPMRYQWTNGSEVVGTLPQYTISKPGNYKVTIKDGSGCQVTSEIFEWKERSKMEIKLEGNAYYCEGDSTLLSVSVSGGLPPYSYIWTKNGSGIWPRTDKIFVNSPGNYTVLVADKSGCYVPNPVIQVTEKRIPVLVFPDNMQVVTYPDKVLLTASKMEGATYQWKNNGVNIAGAVKDSFEARESGKYSVLVTTKGCSGISNTVEVLVHPPLASEPVTPGNMELTVAPNPAHEMVEIRLTSSKVFPVQVELTDVNGKILKKWMLDQMADSHRLSVSLSGYPSGVYFVKASNKEEVLVRKLLKQ